MGIEEAIANMEGFIEEVRATIVQECAIQAMNAKALIQHRIQEQGVNQFGASLGDYSNNKLPTFFFAQKGNKEAQKKLAKEYPDGISYEEWRRINGRQVNHVDLTFTRGGVGMFGSTGIVAESFDDNVVRVSIAGKDEFTNEKLGWNADRYGDILGLTAAEEQLIGKQFEDYLLKTALNYHLV